MDSKALTDLSTMCLVALGALAMMLSLVGMRKLLHLLDGTRHNRSWKILSGLAAFFLVGYLATLVLIFTDNFESLFAILTGVIFFFGALFVFLVVRTGRLTIEDLLRTTEACLQAEKSLREYKDHLEEMVSEKTAALVEANQHLQSEVIERRRAEEVARESAEKYAIVADNTYNWEFWCKPTGEFIYTSPSCERITGHPASEFADDPDLFRRIIHPDDRSLFDLHDQTLTSAAVEAELEYRVVRPDGSIRWIGHVCLPVFDQAGDYLGRRGSNLDITERKQAEAMARESNALYKALFDRAPFGVLIQDPTTLLPIAFNDAAYRELGYCREEFAQMRVGDYEARDSSEVAAAREASLQERGWDEFEAKHLTKTGGIRDVHVTRQLLELEGRSVIHATCQDISERKAHEQQLAYLATHDSLTGLPSHRHLMDRLDEEMARAKRSGHPLAVMMMDIDGFKLYNDTYGHTTGDEVLRLVAKILSETLRSTDFVGRYGGDEFLALLPETDSDGARIILDRITVAIQAQQLEVPDSLKATTDGADLESPQNQGRGKRPGPSHCGFPSA